jgi:hypothetical protein
MRLKALTTSLVTFATGFILTAGLAWADGATVAQDLSRYKEESVPGGKLMLIAYMVLWGLVGAYAIRTALRQSRTERDLAALQDRLDHFAGSATPAGAPKAEK